MIGRRSQRKPEEVEVVEGPKSFDDFELRLGDTMRGERATMGKSLLDVQRELRIKASYIAAIENSDPTAFDTPGFIAGYVRSYARYLGMDPDETFDTFCQESGFTVAHGMSAEASGKKHDGMAPLASDNRGAEAFAIPGSGFHHDGGSLFQHIEARAIGSTLVLLALIGGIGYGGWSVLKEVQQVQFAPVEQAPVVLSDLDPLSGAATAEAEDGATPGLPSAEALDRLYRPQALDVPVLVSRDAPISTLDPRNVGTFPAPELPEVQIASAQMALPEAVPQVLEEAPQQLKVLAVRTAWMRIKAPDGTVIFEETLPAGSTYEVPSFEEPPILRAGASGAVYFEIGDKHYGPVGDPGTVTDNVTLAIDAVTESYSIADLTSDDDLRRYAEAQTQPVEQDLTPAPEQ
ncbi:helix-turn-helix domain-containing protein [Primorskyibacter sp. S87]|uniref:helix-turn-helix domain-containing protein n=1 Tax=Primorskyibacter sp. S87 TaxID=3415126 RepID=UPI003C7B4AEB